MTQPYEQDGGSPRTPPHAPAEHILVVDLGTTVTTATLLMGPEAQPIPDPVAGARSWPSRSPSATAWCATRPGGS
ncbi:hypothetical protein [Streptomyces sp. HUAS TT3]|uniref:hypothetical protein n=1 Tax=Streptomyces sp. HUAS TT3 TaxID=3447510 RepID=UPI003F656721